MLERIERGDVEGAVSTAVLAEVTHRLMLAEALSRGFVEPGNLVAKLRARPGVVRRLELYQEQVDRIPLLGVDVAALDLATFHRSRQGRVEHGLLTNDSLVLAAARELEAGAIATADRDFRRVASPVVYFPADLG